MLKWKFLTFLSWVEYFREVAQMSVFVEHFVRVAEVRPEIPIAGLDWQCLE